MTHTERLLRHIFGSNIIPLKYGNGDTIRTSCYEMALDYITIMYRYPYQKLPTICLYNEENNTGKSTFMNWLQMLFGEKCAIISNGQFTLNINNEYLQKEVICCEEFDMQEHIELLKHLHSSQTVTINKKGIMPVAVPFKAKFITATNRSIIIDGGDRRTWYVKVPPVAHPKFDLLDRLDDEITWFMQQLNNREIIAPQQSYLWFSDEILLQLNQQQPQ